MARVTSAKRLSVPVKSNVETEKGKTRSACQCGPAETDRQTDQERTDLTRASLTFKGFQAELLALVHQLLGLQLQDVPSTFVARS